MEDLSLELALLRHADLPERLDFTTESRHYFARLITAPDAIAPAYMLHSACGDPLGSVVLPSLLEDLELHLLGWIVAYDHARSK